MGNIGTIVSLMRKFTPKGQEMALGIMRRDKKLLTKRDIMGLNEAEENLLKLWA